MGRCLQRAFPFPRKTHQTGLVVAGAADARKLHSLDPRPCGECGRVYSNLSNLRQHMKLIHYPTYVQCPVCRKPFKTDLYLRRHIISAHDAAHRYSFDGRVKEDGGGSCSAAFFSC